MTTAKPTTTIEPIRLSELPPQPLVSVLTSNYNYGRYVGQAIESVLAQSYPHFEMIVCDDGSTDNSVERVLHYAETDSRIKLITKSNGGQASAWNRAYERSSGSIVCILDSDDLFVPEKLETVVRLFQQQPDVGLVIHPMLVIDGQGNQLRQVPPYPDFEQGWIGPQVMARGGRWRAMYGSALCFRRDIAEVIFPVPPEMGKTDADNFIMRIGPLLTPVSSTPAPLVQYRSHERNSSHTGGTALDTKQLLQRREQLITRSVLVNQRLSEAGLDDRLLPVGQSALLNYWIALLDGSSIVARLRQLLSLVLSTLQTEQDATIKKWGKIAIFGLAIALPRSRRAALMDRFFSPYAYNHRARPWQSWTFNSFRRRLLHAREPLGTSPRSSSP